MTPTLYGRWQTRILLLITIGFVISIALVYFSPERFDLTTVLALLGYVILFGLPCDIAYDRLQTLRWDYDWPPVYQLFAGIWEGAFLWSVINAMYIWQMFGFSSLPGVNPNLPFRYFLIHYSTVWLFTFLASQGLLRIIFPRWRYNGGEWL